VKVRLLPKLKVGRLPYLALLGSSPLPPPTTSLLAAGVGQHSPSPAAEPSAPPPTVTVTTNYRPPGPWGTRRPQMPPYYHRQPVPLGELVAVAVSLESSWLP
jgi:hypothetical protein